MQSHKVSKVDLNYKLHLSLLKIIRFFKLRLTREEQLYAMITPYAGTSSFFGKKEIIDFICQTLPDRTAKILDVGPGRGIYNVLLKQAGYTTIDAVEIYKPYIDKFNLSIIYSTVFHTNIINFTYDYYDLILFGDVLEHININQAKRVINYAQHHGKLIIVAVPYMDQQIGQQLDGSGDHQQCDLTRDVFLERYENFNLLIDNEKTGVFFSFHDL
jgi:2-polyprenyl-3-methyl-5-hydroxy-6-metoxy-1,4-benzoquinol methylase